MLFKISVCVSVAHAAA